MTASDNPESRRRRALAAMRVADLRIPYPFPLRPDFLALIELPDDLTPEEAERVAAYVRALARDKP